MELISLGALNALLTAIVVSALVVAVSALSARFLVRGVGGLPQLFVILLGFSLLGFVVGQLMGNSREPAVGTVVPAVLTLIGGVAAYAIGSRGVRAQLKVAAMLITFTMALFIGTVSGIQIRSESDDESEEPNRLRERGLALENTTRAIEVQRLQNYIDVLKLQQDFAKEEGLDLSRFESAYEKRRDKKPDGDQAGTAKQTKPGATK